MPKITSQQIRQAQLVKESLYDPDNPPELLALFDTENKLITGVGGGGGGNGGNGGNGGTGGGYPLITFDSGVDTGGPQVVPGDGVPVVFNTFPPTPPATDPDVQPIDWHATGLLGVYLTTLDVTWNIGDPYPAVTAGSTYVEFGVVGNVSGEENYTVLAELYQDTTQPYPRKLFPYKGGTVLSQVKLDHAGEFRLQAMQDTDAEFPLTVAVRVLSTKIF